MTLRNAYHQRAQARIHELYESVDRHELYLQSMEPASREAHLPELQALQQKRGHVDGLMKDLEQSEESGWERLRGHIDEAIDDLKDSFENARRKLSDSA